MQSFANEAKETPCDKSINLSYKFFSPIGTYSEQKISDAVDDIFDSNEATQLVISATASVTLACGTVGGKTPATIEVISAKLAVTLRRHSTLSW